MYYSDKRCDLGSQYRSLGAGVSHDDIVAGAGCNFYDFKDPRSGHNGKLRPDRYYLDARENKIVGVDLRDGEGNFACSYVGKDYEDIFEQNHADFKQNEKQQYDKVNLNYGAMRQRWRSDFDDRAVKNAFSKEVEFKPQASNEELYNKYTGITNPVSGNTMTCEAVYAEKGSNEVKYVEFRDEGQAFHYVARIAKSVDQQIVEDMNSREQSQTEAKINNRDRAINQGVRR